MEEDREYFSTLSRQACARGCPVYSHFLNLAQQKAACAALSKDRIYRVLFGGAENCERKMLGLCEDEEPCPEAFPIVCLWVRPRSKRFSAPLAHRDVLGALMGLGIERDVTGDILLSEDGAHIFVESHMAAYIAGALNKIGAVDVECTESVPPASAVRGVVEVRLMVSSPRTDAVVARLFHLSRGDAQELFGLGRVFVDDSECRRPDYILREGQVLSVRGYGRALYKGVEKQTKKGRDCLLIELYS